MCDVHGEGSLRSSTGISVAVRKLWREGYLVIVRGPVLTHAADNTRGRRGISSSRVGQTSENYTATDRHIHITLCGITQNPVF